MTPIGDDKPTIDICQDDFQATLREQVRLAVRCTLVTILNEVDAFIGAGRYERTDQRRDQRNGTYPRSLGTTVGQIEDLPVPRTRKGVRSQVFDRYQRRRAELDQGIGEMYVQGASTPKVGQVTARRPGGLAVPGDGGSDRIEPGPSTVSRVFRTLDGEYTAWKQRPLDAHHVYAVADGTYFTVIYDSEGHKMLVLAVAGINQQGERQVLGFTVGERENQGAWEDLLDALKRRGVQQVDPWVTDGKQAMLNAIGLRFQASQRQRCVKHKMENVLGYVPTSQQDAWSQN